MELVSREAMRSITYILPFSNAKSRILAFQQTQAIQPTTAQADGAVSPGWSKCVQLLMGLTRSTHPTFPYSPVSLPLVEGGRKLPATGPETGESRTTV